MAEKNGKNVLLTGITSGIGKALAHQFAKNGYDLIGVARNQDKLKEVSGEFKEKYGIEVLTIQKDLANDGAAQEVYDEVKKTGRTVNILVNDAGVGQWGKFVDVPMEKYSELIHLNIVALTHLSSLYMKEMVSRNEGKVLNLGSIGGFQPGPLMSVYNATKSYIVSFSEALATELEEMESKVTVTCLCPGPTDTNFFSRADMENTMVVENKEMTMQPPEKVAEGAYEALMDGERIFIPGGMNKVTTFIRRVIPKSTQSKLQLKYYEKQEE